MYGLTGPIAIFADDLIVKGVSLRNFIFSFWAVFWRSVIVLVVNALILHGVAQLAHALFLQTEATIKIRLSLSHLPAAALFVLLALRQSVSRAPRMQAPSVVWRNIYLALAAAAAFIVIAKSGAALLLSTDRWIATGMLLPSFLFLGLWPGLAVYLMISRQKSNRTVSAEN